MAIGIIFVYLTPGYAPNLMSYLFGSILTVSAGELWLMLALAIIIILFFTFFYRTILYISFDEDFARTSELPVNLFNYLLMILISLTIVLNIRVVGIILILSLLTIPQATANILTREFGRMIVYSVGFAFIAAFIGLLISYFADIPSGATIIFTQVSIFGLVKLIKTLNH
jgi:zinc transport system permease protein